MSTTPDQENLKEIHVDIKVASSGIFSANMRSSEDGENGRIIFSSDGEDQHMVKSGETFNYTFPLTVSNRFGCMFVFKLLLEWCF